MPLTEPLDLCGEYGFAASAPPPAVTVYRRDAPSMLETHLYEPELCIVLQGAKMMRSGDQTVKIGAGNALIISHHLPVVSQITQASQRLPLLTIVLSLNLATLRELYAQRDGRRDQDKKEGAISSGPSEAGWMDPLCCYLEMVQDQTALSVLGPQLLHEIHFRLLTSPTAALLRYLLSTDGYASRISRSIDVIRGQLSDPLCVPDIAEQIGMSNSAFHTHFEAVTGTAPLQYQKDRRPITATELLENSGRSVASAAYEVGYESPTHFSCD